MKNLIGKVRGWFSSEDRILALVLFLSFMVVVCLVKKIGASYDEPNFYNYAENNLKAIYNLATGQPFDASFDYFNLMYYGAAYLILGSLPVRLLMAIVPFWNRYDAWHLINFTVFLISVWVIYRLCCRFVSKKAALFGALIYLSQPLLDGHAIINPKDSPFMAFFVVTVAVGFVAVEKMASPAPSEQVKTHFFSLSSTKRRWAITGVAMLMILVFDRIFGNLFSRPIISFLFHPGEAQVFQNGLAWVNGIEFCLIVLAALSGLIFLLSRLRSETRWLILAGFCLGLTTAIRVLGPAAGGLVLLYALLKKPRKSYLWLGIYLLAGLATTYLFWPYLWNAPLSRFIDSVKVMSNFPWSGLVRFEGVDYQPNALPWYYLPKLIGIQLTIPLLLLAVTGMGLSLTNILKHGRFWEVQVVLFSWFVLPLAGMIIFRPVLYDNFRQELFMLPPLFCFAALAFDFLLVKIQHSLLQNGLLVGMLLPGLIASIWLFPYLYIYYNGLVGWTGQVGRQYETDYWGLSYCEAGRYLDTLASPQTSIGFTDQMYAELFEHCSSRPYRTLVEAGTQTAIEPVFSVVLTRNDDDLTHFSEMDVMKTFGRGHTLFLVIKTR